MIIVTGSVQLRPDNRARAIELGCDHSRRSRSEAGCLAHNCMIDAEDPDRLCFIEEWQDMAVLQAHFKVPASGEFVREISAMASSPPIIRIFDANALDQTPF